MPGPDPVNQHPITRALRKTYTYSKVTWIITAIIVGLGIILAFACLSPQFRKLLQSSVGQPGSLRILDIIAISGSGAIVLSEAIEVGVRILLGRRRVPQQPPAPVPVAIPIEADGEPGPEQAEPARAPAAAQPPLGPMPPHARPAAPPAAPPKRPAPEEEDDGEERKDEGIIKEKGGQVEVNKPAAPPKPPAAQEAPPKAAADPVPPRPAAPQWEEVPIAKRETHLVRFHLGQIDRDTNQPKPWCFQWEGKKIVLDSEETCNRFMKEVLQKIGKGPIGLYIDCQETIYNEFWHQAEPFFVNARLLRDMEVTSQVHQDPRYLMIRPYPVKQERNADGSVLRTTYADGTVEEVNQVIGSRQGTRRYPDGTVEEGSFDDLGIFLYGCRTRGGKQEFVKGKHKPLITHGNIELYQIGTRDICVKNLGGDNYEIIEMPIEELLFQIAKKDPEKLVNTRMNKGLLGNQTESNDARNFEGYGFYLAANFFAYLNQEGPEGQRWLQIKDPDCLLRFAYRRKFRPQINHTTFIKWVRDGNKQELVWDLVKRDSKLLSALQGQNLIAEYFLADRAPEANFFIDRMDEQQKAQCLSLYEKYLVFVFNNITLPEKIGLTLSQEEIEGLSNQEKEYLYERAIQMGNSRIIKLFAPYCCPKQIPVEAGAFYSPSMNPEEVSDRTKWLFRKLGKQGSLQVDLGKSLLGEELRKKKNLKLFHGMKIDWLVNREMIAEATKDLNLIVIPKGYLDIVEGGGFYGARAITRDITIDPRTLQIAMKDNHQIYIEQLEGMLQPLDDASVEVMEQVRIFIDRTGYLPTDMVFNNGKAYIKQWVPLSSFDQPAQALQQFAMVNGEHQKVWQALLAKICPKGVLVKGEVPKGGVQPHDKAKALFQELYDGKPRRLHTLAQINSLKLEKLNNADNMWLFSRADIVPVIQDLDLISIPTGHLVMQNNRSDLTVEESTLRLIWGGSYATIDPRINIQTREYDIYIEPMEGMQQSLDPSVSRQVMEQLSTFIERTRCLPTDFAFSNGRVYIKNWAPLSGYKDPQAALQEFAGRCMGRSWQELITKVSAKPADAATSEERARLVKLHGLDKPRSFRLDQLGNIT